MGYESLKREGCCKNHSKSLTITLSSNFLWRAAFLVFSFSKSAVNSLTFFENSMILLTAFSDFSPVPELEEQKLFYKFSQRLFMGTISFAKMETILKDFTHLGLL